MSSPNSSTLWLSLSFAVLLGTAGASAKERKQSAKGASAPAESAATAQPAYLRVWKDRLNSGRSIRVKVQGASAKKSPVALELSPSGPAFGDYTAIPAGAGTIQIEEAEKPNASLAKLTKTMAPNSFWTLILREENDQIATELIDDTPSSKDTAAGELTVRNFAPDLREIGVSAGKALVARLRATDGFLQARGLERSLITIETTAVSTSGKESKWTNELDLQANQKATLLIYADPYGRIRPRITLDGVLPAPAKPEATDTGR